MCSFECEYVGFSRRSPLNSCCEFAILFGHELDWEFVITKASLVFKGPIDIRETQLSLLKGFHVLLMSIVLDVDVETSNTPWATAKAYLFGPLVGGSTSISNCFAE